MNKIYKVIWSHACKCYAVVSEIAKKCKLYENTKNTDYTLYSVITNYLDANYRKLMKCIWQRIKQRG